jgi:hypothetical protein
MTFSWYRSSGSKSPWSFVLVSSRFKIWKCSTNPYLTLFSINGHSLI